jgi:hypothetical protein
MIGLVRCPGDPLQLLFLVLLMVLSPFLLAALLWSFRSRK